MKGIVGWFSAKFTRKAKWITLSIAILVVAITVAIIIGTNAKPQLDVEPLIHTLQQASELTTAELTYKGFAEFEDEGTVFLNRSDFKMKYTAIARIGIDIEKVKVSADDSKKVIYVTIPKAAVLDVKVDTSSIQYFDTKFSLFNTDQKEDSNRAVALAEEQAKKEIEAMGSLKMADDQAAALIKGLLADAIPNGYRIEIRR